MPPQAGVFALPLHNSTPDLGSSYSPVPPVTDDMTKPFKDKKRREIVAKLGKDLSDQRKDDYADTLVTFQQATHQLSVAPHTYPAYNLTLYPISIERAAMLHQLNLSEEHAFECAQVAWEEERAKVEEEWRKGRERIRDRMLEGIEDRRKRARDDKDGEGTIAESGLDSQSRPHVTRKLRNKLPHTHPGRSPSPPPTHNPVPAAYSTISLTNAYSLALDTLPSPFPLALPLKEPLPRRGGKQNVPTQQVHSNGLANNRAGNGDGGLIPIVGTGAAMGLGKSIAGLTSAREIDVESDLMELRRGARRKRAVGLSLGRG